VITDHHPIRAIASNFGIKHALGRLNIEHPTLNIERPTLNIERPTLNIERPIRGSLRSANL
jgi:hypothetical protein